MTKLNIAIGAFALYKTHHWCLNLGWDLNEIIRTHPEIPQREAARRLGEIRCEQAIQRFEIWTTKLANIIRG